jgi:very-short-patch-repair endonuclease
MADMVDRYLASQLGLVTLEQTLEAGMSERTRKRRCASGEWVRVHRRVYRSTAFPQSHEQRLLAAALCAGPGAAVSHYAAASTWGVDGFTASMPQVSIADDRKVVIAGAQLHRIPDLTPEHVTMIGPIPITTRARTLVDLGAVARPFLVSRALEQWLRERHVTIAQVRATLDEVARRGRAGAGVLRDVLDTRALRLDASDSHPEVVLAEALRARGAPPPVYHYLVQVGHETFEVDFAYPEAMLLIEVDGFSAHTTPEAFEEDPRRQNLLVDKGYMVRRYTAKRVIHRADAVAAEIDHWRRARTAAAAS